MEDDTVLWLVLPHWIAVVLSVGLYHRIGSQASGEALDRRREVAWRWLTGIFLAAVAAGCAAPDRRSGPPNVVLISIDTLRPDRLGYLGHARNTTPNIDGLADEGVVFTDSYSVSGWTLPSMATILTGHHPRHHGATDFHWSLRDDLPTLAEILKRRGYATRAYVSHVILTPKYGLDRGFDTYDASVLRIGDPHKVATARELTDRVLNDLGATEEPFFLWVHYFDPHFAYLPHAEWSHLGDSDLDRYDQEIAHTDRQIARLLAHLRDRGSYDDTILVFTSDHGEEFGEHGGQYHETLHEEVLRVPLVIRGPSLAPRVDDSRVEQIDLLPTLLALLDIAADETGPLPGRDLFAPAPTAPRPVFFERDRPPEYNQRGVLLGPHKLLVIEKADLGYRPASTLASYAEVKNVHPGTYLYDLSTDPAETRSLYAENESKARELFVLLAEHFAGESAPLREVEIDPVLRERLRSLGYVR